MTVLALARYRLSDDGILQVNADNLFDERYYSGQDDNHANVGARRSIHIELQFRR